MRMAPCPAGPHGVPQARGKGTLVMVALHLDLMWTKPVAAVGAAAGVGLAAT
jgi:hypothetical protein